MNVSPRKDWHSRSRMTAAAEVVGPGVVVVVVVVVVVTMLAAASPLPSLSPSPLAPPWPEVASLSPPLPPPPSSTSSGAKLVEPDPKPDPDSSVSTADLAAVVGVDATDSGEVSAETVDVGASVGGGGVHDPNIPDACRAKASFSSAASETQRCLSDETKTTVFSDSAAAHSSVAPLNAGPSSSNCIASITDRTADTAALLLLLLHDGIAAGDDDFGKDGTKTSESTTFFPREILRQATLAEVSLLHAASTSFKAFAWVSQRAPGRIASTLCNLPPSLVFNLARHCTSGSNDGVVVGVVIVVGVVVGVDVMDVGLHVLNVPPRTWLTAAFKWSRVVRHASISVDGNEKAPMKRLHPRRRAAASLSPKPDARAASRKRGA